VFTPILRAEQDDAQQAFPAENPYPQSYPAFGAQPSDASRPSSSSDTGTGDLGTGDPGTGELASNGAAESGHDGGDSDDDYKGLPRRVRQASLAPELRASAAAAASSGPPGVPRASAESLTVMRNTLSAMQRGWQQGRSQSQGDSEGDVNGD
jgi:hypothetical protein